MTTTTKGIRRTGDRNLTPPRVDDDDRGSTAVNSRRFSSTNVAPFHRRSHRLPQPPRTARPRPYRTASDAPPRVRPTPAERLTPRSPPLSPHPDAAPAAREP
ncbi:proline-rich receptor-like protein kinase PERK9 [Iris pallida]|uniref:Proline-rich receptor-like protein kinase PERK9 n=1 Tax=Iris pallida TaxID=29817 RepID=A0AAX6G0T4_IRIPA|nr:proline-rich receptor-like protein kinase PERK9 [Iris pallida]